MAPKPHNHHALCKASAKHLHAAGHITTEQRNQIFAKAQRGMKAAAKQRATQRAAANPAPEPMEPMGDMGGGMGGPPMGDEGFE